jgi:hypothetical protein
MKEIQLTQGKIAIIDDEDYEFLSQWKWCYYKTGYAIRSAYNKETKRRYSILMHRVIMHTPDGMDTDHINHNTLDNRKSNLRICTHSQNQMNKHKQSNNTSGHTGVSWHKRNHQWQAQIKLNGKYISLGFHDDIDEAIDAYDMKARELFGEFAEVIGE